MEVCFRNLVAFPLEVVVVSPVFRGGLVVSVPSLSSLFSEERMHWCSFPTFSFETVNMTCVLVKGDVIPTIVSTT